MHAALSAICTHETPNIIKQQQAEIAKLRAQLADKQKDYDELDAATTRMAHRIVISASRELEVQDIDEEEIDEYLREALQFFDGDIEENLRSARENETTRTVMAQDNIRDVDAENEETDVLSTDDSDEEADGED